MEYEIKIYHKEELDDEYYIPFSAVCSYEEMIRLMNFALVRDYIVLVSAFNGEEKK